MTRVVLLLDDSLGRGEVGNIAAILMGQAVLQAPDLYDHQQLRDSEGNLHSAIRCNTIVLSASRRQILNLLPDVRDKSSEIMHALFTKIGQGLHNAFDQYSVHVQNHSAEEMEPIGLLLCGEDSEIRRLTKKFSLLR